MNRRDAEKQRIKKPKSRVAGLNGHASRSMDPPTQIFSAPPRLRGEEQWLLWQLADSAFPTGGFAHSGGLEAAWQQGEVRGSEALTEYLRSSLLQLARTSMPFTFAAFAGKQEFMAIDMLCDAFLSNHVANRASRLQGQAFLTSAERIFALDEITAFRTELLSRELPGHFATVFGVIARFLRIESAVGARLFVFTQMRGSISAAVRLNIVGPGEGQAIQHRLTNEAENAALLFGEVPMAEATQSAPLLDLWQGTQDRLYSRLFQT